MNVRGIGLDPQSRCAHWHGPADIVAIKFKCCGEYYACRDCHDALARHQPAVWPRGEWSAVAVRCGACGSELTIDAYLESGAHCPSCAAAFNPRCALHHHFYFEAPSAGAPPATNA
jgi:uncharacterized CHY-type Zn-finger protein